MKVALLRKWDSNAVKDIELEVGRVVGGGDGGGGMEYNMNDDDDD